MSREGGVLHMDDSFHEMIVKAKVSSQDRLKIVGLIFAGLALILLAILFGNYLGSFSLILVAGIGYGLFYFLRGFSREYEYTITNGELDIDLIIAQRKRRRVFSGAARMFESMEPLANQEDRQRTAGVQILDCRSRLNPGSDYRIRTDYNGKPLIIYFSPDEKILTQLRKYNPGRIRLG